MEIQGLLGLWLLLVGCVRGEGLPQAFSTGQDGSHPKPNRNEPRSPQTPSTLP